MTLDPGNSVYREWPFTVRVPTWQLAIPGPGPQQSGGEDTVVVQGVADVVLITPAGAVVIDFKTDQRSQDQTGPNEVLYGRQLGIYAMAVETILGTRVISKWIYALADGRALPVA
jgi:ATP-dependent exoDNAse (exonuclease V) beta subunit